MERRSGDYWGRVDELVKSLSAAGGRLVKLEEHELLVAFDAPIPAAQWMVGLITGKHGSSQFPVVGIGAHTALTMERHNAAGTEFVGEVEDWARLLSQRAPDEEILLTGTLWEAAGIPLRRDRSLKVEDLPRARLPGSEDVEAVHRLSYQQGGTEPVDLSGLVELPTNLPNHSEPFLGRSKELVDLTGNFASGSRVVVITGPAGIGKSRLARRFAASQLERFAEAGGVYQCELAGVRSLDALVSSVARALHIPLRSGGIKGINQLSRALASRGPTLLLLDGFDSLADRGAIALEQWLRAAPELRLLLTTTVKVDVQADTFLLGPMDPESAMLLFGLKATLLDPDFDLEKHRDEVMGIVERLEAIPLAVELAAAWSRVLPPAVIRSRLSESLRMLSGAPAARTTMAAVMQWSWQLLEHWERTALAQLSVFRSGASLEAVDGVLDSGPGLRGRDAMTLIMSLRNKSLVRTESHPEDPDVLRVGLYEVVRDYAEQRAMAFGLHRATAHHHAVWYLEQAERWAQDARGRHAQVGLRRLSVDRPNLMAAWRYLVTANAEMATRLALALHPLLAARGPFDEHLPLLDEAVRLAEDLLLERRIRLRCARVDALLARGHYDRAHNDLTATLEDLSEVAAEADQPQLLAMVKHRMGQVEIQWGDVAPARAHLEQAIEFYESAGDPHTAAQARSNLAAAMFTQGEWETSRANFIAALDTLREVGDVREVGMTSALLGNLRRAMGEEAQALYEEALQSMEAVGDVPGEGRVLDLLGSMYLDRDDADRAEEIFQRALALHRRVGDSHREAIAKGNLGRVFQHRSELRRALDHYGDALLTLQSLGDRRFMAIFQSNRGVAFQEAGDNKRAMVEHEQAIEALRLVGDLRFQALVLGRMATTLATLDQVGEAQTSLEEAEEIMESLGDPGGRTVIAFQRSHVELLANPGFSKLDVSRVLQRATSRMKRISWDLRLALRVFQVSAVRAIRRRARG